jgi:hypothetical protein
MSASEASMVKKHRHVLLDGLECHRTGKESSAGTHQLDLQHKRSELRQIDVRYANSVGGGNMLLKGLVVPSVNDQSAIFSLCFQNHPP